MECINCHDSGHVCENHPDLPWGDLLPCAHSCDCGAGMPCPNCCSPIPDGARIGWAFIPDRLRPPEMVI